MPVQWLDETPTAPRVRWLDEDEPSAPAPVEEPQPVSAGRGLKAALARGIKSMFQQPAVAAAIASPKAEGPTMSQGRKAFEASMSDPRYMQHLMDAGDDPLKLQKVESLYGPTSKLPEKKNAVREIWAGAVSDFEQEKAATPRSPAQGEMSQAKTQGDKWKVFFKYPGQTLATIALESIPPTVAGAFIGTAVGGPGVGTAAGAGLSSYTSTLSSELLGEASRKGYDITDADSLQKFLDHPKDFDAALNMANTKAAIVGSIDGATAGTAGKFIGPALKEGLRSVLKASGKELAVQAAGGATGEALGQKASGQPLDWFDIAMEAAAEVAGAPAEVLMNVRSARKAPDVEQPLAFKEIITPQIERTPTVAPEEAPKSVARPTVSPEQIEAAKQAGYTFDGMMGELAQFTRRNDPKGAATEGATFYLEPTATPEQITEKAKAKTDEFLQGATRSPTKSPAREGQGSIPAAPPAIPEVKKTEPEHTPVKPTPINQDVPTSENLNQEIPTTTTFDPVQVPTLEVPVEQITQSKDVPQFKEGADVGTGVVPGQELAGKYERLGTGPIVVWKRVDGTYEVITGRHRLDLAKRSGEKTIPAQVVEEAKGFTRDMAITFDAEANIRDGQGSVEDYAHYFKNSQQLSQEQAESRGLLSRSKGQAGWDLGRNASDDLYAIWKDGKISEAQALAIVRSAPGNPSAQQIGIRYARAGKAADFISNIVKAAMAESGGRAETLDLFGNDDSTLKAMEQQAKKASEAMKELREQVLAAQGAAKRPEAAKKLGVDVNDPAAVRVKLDSLKRELVRWDNWPLHPDLVAMTKPEVVKSVVKTEAKPNQPAKLSSELFDPQDTPFNLTGEAVKGDTVKPAESTTGYGEQTAAQQEMFAIQQVVESKDPVKSANAAEKMYGGASKAIPVLERQLEVVDSDPATKRAFTKPQRAMLKNVIALLRQRAKESISQDGRPGVFISELQELIRQTVPEGVPTRVVTGAEAAQMGMAGDDGFLLGGTIHLVVDMLPNKETAQKVLNEELAHYYLGNPEAQAEIKAFADEHLKEEDREALRQQGYEQRPGESESDYRQRLNEEWVAKQARESTPLWKRLLQRLVEFFKKAFGIKLSREEVVGGLLRRWREQGIGSESNQIRESIAEQRQAAVDVASAEVPRLVEAKVKAYELAS